MFDVSVVADTLYWLGAVALLESALKYAPNSEWRFHLTIASHNDFPAGKLYSKPDMARKRLVSFLRARYERKLNLEVIEQPPFAASVPLPRHSPYLLKVTAMRRIFNDFADCDSVLMLDADCLVTSPINSLFDACADKIWLSAVPVTRKVYYPDEWSKIFGNAPEDYSFRTYGNTGVVMFPRSQSDILDLWISNTERVVDFLASDSPKPTKYERESLANMDQDALNVILNTHEFGSCNVWSVFPFSIVACYPFKLPRRPINYRMLFLTDGQLLARPQLGGSWVTKVRPCTVHYRCLGAKWWFDYHLCGAAKWRARDARTTPRDVVLLFGRMLLEESGVLDALGPFLRVL